MKALHVIPSLSKVHGGPSHALAIMERSLTDLGISVTTATTDDDGPGRRLTVVGREQNVDGVTRFYARKWTEFYKVAPGLLVWLMHHGRRFDVIHIHALFSFSSVAAVVAALMWRVPYIVRPLGTLNDYGVNQRRPRLKAASFKLIESRILAHAAAVHFTSQREWDEAKALGVAMRGVVIPLGVDDWRSAKDNGPPAVLRGARRKVVLFLSRLDPKKNVEGLVRAFALISQQHPEAMLVIAGNGPVDYVESLRQLAEAEGLAERVIWTGYVEGEQKWSTLAAADVFVLPSYSENFGIAAVEALLAGRPCVIGRGVAIGEAIADAGCGVVTDCDPSSIAEGLDRLLSDDTLRREMGSRGRSLADRDYSSKVMAKRLVSLYSNIAGSAKSDVLNERTSEAIASSGAQSRQLGSGKEI